MSTFVATHMMEAMNACAFSMNSALMVPGISVEDRRSRIISGPVDTIETEHQIFNTAVIEMAHGATPIREEVGEYAATVENEWRAGGASGFEMRKLPARDQKLPSLLATFTNRSSTETGRPAFSSTLRFIGPYGINSVIQNFGYTSIISPPARRGPLLRTTFILGAGDALLRAAATLHGWNDVLATMEDRGRHMLETASVLKKICEAKADGVTSGVSCGEDNGRVFICVYQESHVGLNGYMPMLPGVEALLSSAKHLYGDNFPLDKAEG